jgi:hypothetical protein
MPEFGRIARSGATHRLPAMAFQREFPDAGGLMSYGASIPVLYRRAAYYVDKVLKGAKPADLPVEQPTQFDLVLNQRRPMIWGSAFPVSAGSGDRSHPVALFRFLTHRVASAHQLFGTDPPSPS